MIYIDKILDWSNDKRTLNNANKKFDVPLQETRSSGKATEV